MKTARIIFILFLAMCLPFIAGSEDRTIKRNKPSGHGMQMNGRNYLIPVEAKIESESEVEYESVDAGRILGKMNDAGNRMNIVILDACRDNKFARSFRTQTNQGLAPMKAPTGSLSPVVPVLSDWLKTDSGCHLIFSKNCRKIC